MVDMKLSDVQAATDAEVVNAARYYMITAGDESRSVTHERLRQRLLDAYATDRGALLAASGVSGVPEAVAPPPGNQQSYMTFLGGFPGWTPGLPLRNTLANLGSVSDADAATFRQTIGVRNYFRGQASPDPTEYVVGEHVLVGTVLYFCVGAGTYTSAQIPVSSSWRLVTAQGLGTAQITSSANTHLGLVSGELVNLAIGAHPNTRTLEQVQDIAGAMWSTVPSVSYDDPAGKMGIVTLTQALATNAASTAFGLVSGERLAQAVAAFGSGAGRTLEELQDAVAAMLTGNSEFSYDDPAGTLAFTAAALLRDDTLRGDGVTTDLGVNVTEVIDALTEDVEYYTLANDSYPENGATAGQVYTTSRYQKDVHKISCWIDTNSIDGRYRARIYRVNDSNVIQEKLGDSIERSDLHQSASQHSFWFSHGGVSIPANARIAIVVSRTDRNEDVLLRTGAEASASPHESYDDAANDFDLAADVAYDASDPQVGRGTHHHGTNIRGNLKIYYTVTYHHGAFAGAGKADTDLQNIDDDLTDAEKATVRSRIGAAAQAGSGLTLEQVQDAVAAMMRPSANWTYDDAAGTLTANFAGGGAPAYAAGTTYQTGQLVTHNAAVWLRTGAAGSGVDPAFAASNPWTNLSTVDHFRGQALDPSTYYAPGDMMQIGHEIFFATGSRSATRTEILDLANQGAHFLRLGAFGTAHIFVIEDGDVEYTSDTVVNLDPAHSDAESVGDIYIWRYTQAVPSGETGDLSVRVNSSTGRPVKVVRSGALGNLKVSEIVRGATYIIEKTAATEWQLIGRTADLTTTGGVSAEAIQDIVGPMFSHNANITYNDAANRVDVSTPVVYGTRAANPPTAANDDALLWDTGIRRLYRNVLHPGHGATASYRAFTTNDLRSKTSNSSLNYRGEVNAFGFLPDSPAENDTYYIRNDEHFVYWNNTTWILQAVTDFIPGLFLSEAEATRALGEAVGSGTGTGKVLAFDPNGFDFGSIVPRVSTAYSAPVSDVRQWVDYLANLPIGITLGTDNRTLSVGRYSVVLGDYVTALSDGGHDLSGTGHWGIRADRAQQDVNYVLPTLDDVATRLRVDGGRLKYNELGDDSEVDLGALGGDVYDWAENGNTDRLPLSKHALSVVTGIQYAGLDANQRAHVDFTQASGSGSYLLPIWMGSQATYDGLASKEANVLYFTS